MFLKQLNADKVEELEGIVYDTRARLTFIYIRDSLTGTTIRELGRKNGLSLKTAGKNANMLIDVGVVDYGEFTRTGTRRLVVKPENQLAQAFGKLISKKYSNDEERAI